MGPRIPAVAVIAATVLAISSCGGNDSPKSSGPAGNASTGTSTGATAPQVGKAGTSSEAGNTAEKRKGTSGGTGGSGTGGSGAPSGGASPRTSAGSGGAGTKDKPRNKGKRKLPPIDRALAKRNLYREQKVACRVLGLKRVATEYKAKSLRPRDVAEAYTESSVKAGLPAYARDSVFRGCLAGLTGK